MKKVKGLSIIKMVTMAVLFMAVLMNVQLSYETFIDTKPVVARADDDDGGGAPKRGPLDWFRCTYVDGASTSVSGSVTGSASYSHNTGTTKAGWMGKCRKAEDPKNCYNVDCGPHTPPGS